MKKNSSAIVALLACATSCLWSGTLLARAPDDHKFTPVILISSENANQGNPEVNREIVETVSESFRSSVMQVYAEEIYGSGAAFKKKPFQSGPLGIIGRAFLGFDRGLQNEVQHGKLGSLLSQVQGEVQTYTIEVFWAKAPHSFPTLRDKISGASAIAMLWNMAKATVLPAESAAVESIVSELADIAVVDVKDLPGGRETLSNQGAAVYTWLAEDNQEYFLPMYAAFTLEVMPDRMAVDLRANAKPGQLSMKLDPPEPTDYIQSEYLVFQPPHYVPEPAVGRFIFKRIYEKTGQEKPYAMLSFGRMFDTDVSSLAMCTMKCAELEENGAAKHIQRSAPTVPSKLRVPDTLAGKVGSTLSSLAGKAVSAVNGYVDIFVMLQEITFDLSNPEGPVVVPEKCRVPLIVRTTDPIGNRTYVDVTQNRYGIDFMQKMVAGQTAQELNETVRKDVRDADANGKKKFGEMSDLLKSLFR